MVIPYIFKLATLVCLQNDGNTTLSVAFKINIKYAIKYSVLLSLTLKFQILYHRFPLNVDGWMDGWMDSLAFDRCYSDSCFLCFFLLTNVCLQRKCETMEYNMNVITEKKRTFIKNLIRV